MNEEEILRQLIRNLKGRGFDKKFVRKVLILLQKNEWHSEMLSYLENNPTKELTMSDILIKVIEITRKVDLIEGHFYEINPDLKQ